MGLVRATFPEYEGAIRELDIISIVPLAFRRGAITHSFSLFIPTLLCFLGICSVYLAEVLRSTLHGVVCQSFEST